MGWKDDLQALGPCEPGYDYASAYLTPGLAWSKCTRADWMLWTAWVLADNDAKKTNVLQSVAKCVRRSLSAIPAGETRPEEAIAAFEGYILGLVTADEIDQKWRGLHDVYSPDKKANTCLESIFSLLSIHSTRRPETLSEAVRLAAMVSNNVDAELKLMADSVKIDVPQPTFS